MSKQVKQQHPGLVDAAPRTKTLFEFDVPGDTEDHLHGEVTASFGSIRTICMKGLTPLEEKAAAQASGESINLAAQLAMRSVAGVVNDHGDFIPVYFHDGTLDELWAQMHQKIRQLCIQGYADIAVPAQVTAKSFLASRRIRA